MRTCLLTCVVVLSLLGGKLQAQQGSAPVGSGVRSLLVGTTSQETVKEKVPAIPASTTSAGPNGADAKSTTPTKSELRRVERKELKETPSSSEGEKFLMRYKLATGLRIISEVTHLAKTNTKIDTTEQDSNSRTVSHKAWDITSLKDGNATFEYRILDIDMSQRVGPTAELRYSSEQTDAPLPQFRAAAESVGKVISTVTIDPQGMIIARSDETNPPSLGMGDITVPLPENAVSIGATWETPREMRIRRDDGSQKLVRFRELYKLDKVSAGVATISVRSEMITIISDPKEESQVLQQLSDGVIKFDIDAGRMIAKELSWDKRVVGFAGSGSAMEYSARLDEQVQKTETFAPKARSAKR